MLPFLAKKSASSTGVSTVYRAPDQEKPSESQDSEGLMACASDLHKAINSNDIKGIAAALQAAFEIMESTPHDEAEQPTE